MVFFTTVLMVLSMAAYPPDPGIPWATYAKTHPERHEGFGPVVDDLEQHAPTKHPMRNESDPGNWVHELTHQVQSDLRTKAGEGFNSFYILGGKYLTLPEPNVTLKQVGDEVPTSERGGRFQLYFQSREALRDWNHQPLYSLDEATAYSNGFWYHVQSGSRDDYRREGAKEFVRYGRALVRAVKKYDPKYSRLKDLEAYVEWNGRRVAYMVSLYDGEDPEPGPDLPDYVIRKDDDGR